MMIWRSKWWSETVKTVIFDDFEGSDYDFDGTDDQNHGLEIDLRTTMG